MYDLDQLNKDLSTIANRLGNPVIQGFYTVAHYDDGTIKVVDPTIAPNGPDVYLRDGEEYVLMEKPFPTFHPAGQRILSLMISLEENEQ